MPAPGKPFEQFVADDAICQDFARRQVGVKPSEVASEQVVTGAAVGTAVGAAAGALMGGGHARSTESMAGAGLLAGSAVGAGAAGESRWTLQRPAMISRICNACTRRAIRFPGIRSQPTLYRLHHPQLRLQLVESCSCP
jgi:uncharacterized protein YcfJ